MKCMVAIARREDEPEYFLQFHDEWEEILPEYNELWEFDFQYEERDFEGSRLERICQARNSLVERITDHDAVLFIDSDIVDMHPTLPSFLYEVNPGGITAPLILVEDQMIFYDTSGFIEDGRECRPLPPFFDQEGPLVDLDSVGAVYLAPAALFRDEGVRFEMDEGALTDHLHVCREAKKRGLRVACTTKMAVFHADLPRYGLKWAQKGK